MVYSPLCSHISTMKKICMSIYFIVKSQKLQYILYIGNMLTAVCKNIITFIYK